MLRKFRWLSLVLLIGLLSACTGSFEDLPPTLLIVGYTDTGSGEGTIALVEDRTLNADTAAEGLVFLSDSLRTLPAPPLAFDVVDRINNRTQLIVLSRDDSVAGNPAYLSFVNLQDIDPDNPVDFDFNSPQITINDLDSSRIFCPSAVQVSRSGQYLALLNDQSACGQSESDAIDIIDLNASGGPALVERINFVFVDSFYLLQSPDDNDFLYFFEDSVEPILRKLSLESESLTQEDVVTIPNGDTIYSVVPVGSDLILLQDQQFIPVLNFETVPELQEAIDTSSGSRQIIPDDYRSSQKLLFLGSNRLTVHLDASDEAEETAAVTATYGTLEPLNRFAYLVGEGRITKFDELTYDGSGSVSQKIATFTLTELTQPNFITWLQAKVEALP